MRQEPARRNEANATPGRGRRAGLTAEAVVAKALEVIDSEGLDGLSMRVLASRLGVSPMALYNHVPNKEALLSAVVERLGDEMANVRRSRSWRRQAEGVARAVRRTYLAHPNTIILVQTTTSTSANLLAPIDIALEAFARAGLSPARARSAWIGLAALVTGHVSYQLQGHFGHRVDAERVPRHLESLRAVLSAGPARYDNAFEEALAWYLDGIEDQQST